VTCAHLCTGRPRTLAPTAEKLSAHLRLQCPRTLSPCTQNLTVPNLPCAQRAQICMAVFFFPFVSLRSTRSTACGSPCRKKNPCLKIAMPDAVCDFGCGRAAVKQLKNGRFGCAEFVAQCPAMRAKNRAVKRGKNPFANRAHPRGMAGNVPWNRGLTWEQMYRVDVLQQQQAIRSSRIQSAQHALANSQALELQRRAKLSSVAKRRGLGGYEPGSGRGKKGWYRGHWCDSTYELAFIIWAVDHEIPFERNLELFPYEYEGRLLSWMPDFLLADGTYIEIKGYVTDQARAKFDYFLRPLEVFTRADLDRMFEYVHARYGKNLIALYE
jgi:hypothetical protein